MEKEILITTLCAGYLKSTEKWDKPSVYWPIITFEWIIFFIFYIWTKNIINFYVAIVGTIAYLIGVYARNHIRKKKKINQESI